MSHSLSLSPILCVQVQDLTSTLSGYEVPGIILLYDIKGAMQNDCAMFQLARVTVSAH